MAASYTLHLEEIESRVVPAGTISVGDTVFKLAAGDAGFIVTRTGDLTAAVDVGYTVTDGTAVAGTNYTSAPLGTVHFASGQTTATIPLSILSNNFSEPTRTFAVDLTSVMTSDGQPTFAPQVPFTTGDGPFSVAMTDVNGDGRPDIIVANDGTNTVSVLLNTTPTGGSTLSFSPPFSFGTDDSESLAVTSADINNDGRPDIIVANSSFDSVSVLLNTTPTGDPTPTFATQVPFTVGAFPLSVVSADINGDGRPDIIAANSLSGNVSVLVNTTPTGDPTPTFATQVPFTVGASPLSVVSADINGDGRPDILVANGFVSATVSVLLNMTATGDPSPTFAPQTPITTGLFTTSVAAADVNGDGRPDLIATISSSSTVSVHLNTTSMGATTPTFAPQVSFTTGIAPSLVTSADVNGDGRPDLLVANTDSDSVSVLLNTTLTGGTTPTFATQVPFATQTAPVAVATADVNGDGRPDIITANNFADTVSVLLNALDVLGNHPAAGIIDRAPVVLSFVPLDPTITSATTVRYRIMFSEAISGLTAANFVLTGTATAGASIGTPTTSNGGISWTVPVTTGGNGNLGLTLANRTGIFDGVGNQLYNTTADSGSSFNPVVGSPYTVNKTIPQRPTFVVGAGAGGGSHVKVISGQDGATLQSFFAFPDFTGGVTVASGDVNGDGFADIIVGAGPGGGPHVKVISGQDGSLLQSFFAFPGFTGGVRVASGDMDGDGFADIIVGAGPGGGPHVKVISGQDAALLEAFFAFPDFFGGVFVG